MYLFLAQQDDVELEEDREWYSAEETAVLLIFSFFDVSFLPRPLDNLQLLF
jgi:hypothetical protein